MINATTVDRIHALASDIRVEMINLSSAIWHHPELAFHEHFASAQLSSWLQGKGFSVEHGTGGLETAFIANWGSGSPVIAFLGEYDALPDLSQASGIAEDCVPEPGAPGHGCGHNLLGAGTAGAAVCLTRLMEEQKLSGTVRYYGCPAEESGGGKEILCNAGVFSDVDAAITWHPDKVNRVVTESCLANSIIRADFRGIAAHAATAAFRGRSALDACELMNVGANYLREHVQPETRFHYAYTNSGNPLPNVVSESAGLLYYIRAPKATEAEEVLQRIEKIAQGAALMTETTLSFSHISTLREYRPNRTLASLGQSAFEALGCPVFTEEEQQLAAGFVDCSGPALRTALDPLGPEGICLPYSTDVGNVSQLLPTLQFYTVCAARKTAFHTRKLVAQADLPAAHKGMLTATKVMTLTAYLLLQQPEKLKQAWAEHANG